MMITPLFIGFLPSQVVQDFVHQQYFIAMLVYWKVITKFVLGVDQAWCPLSMWSFFRDFPEMDFPVTILVVHDAGWWQLKYFFDVHPYFGEDDPIWSPHFFQGGWFNHQLECLRLGNASFPWKVEDVSFTQMEGRNEI